MTRTVTTTDTSHARGFTLIELITVVALMIIVTASLLLVRPQADRQTQLRNTASELVLFMRQAQAYGSGVRNPGVGTFRANYGVHLHIVNDRTQFIMFSAPISRGYQYTAMASQADVQVISTLQLPAGAFVRRFCVHDGGNSRCSQTYTTASHSVAPRFAGMPKAYAATYFPGETAPPAFGLFPGNPSQRELDIFFQRPSLDAIVLSYGNAAVQRSRGRRATIELSYRGSVVTIEITQTGLIQVL